MFGTSRESDLQEQDSRCFPNQYSSGTIALGLESIHKLCKQIYPLQINPLTVTTVVKYWLGGPDPLDYISMYENPGCSDIGVPPHWHYVSLGLSDLHGDGRLHAKTGPGFESGFGFELTFRLVRQKDEITPPTWPANLMQQLAKYVFNSGNLLMPGDHVSWHAPLDKGNGLITQILMGKDPQFPARALTPHGNVSFVQIIGVTSDELQAAQHWNGIGVVDLLQSSRLCGRWLVTDMRRAYSIMDVDPTIAKQIELGIAREGSNLSGVSAKCWWVSVDEKNNETYRDNKQESDDEEDIKPFIKTEDGIPPPEPPMSQSPVNADRNLIKELPGLHLTFNLEAGNLLPLAIKGRVMHGRHFTFKSIISHTAVTLVAETVTATIVSLEKPYVVKGPWLQVLIPEQLAARMAQEFEILNDKEQLQLPRTFSWPEHKLMITIVSD